MLNSNVSLPFLSVLTGRGGYSLGGSAGSWKCWPEASVTGLEPAKTAALRTPGVLAEEQRLLQELHLALDRALRRPPVLVKHWEAGASLSSIGEGPAHPHSNPVEFSFLSSIFVPLIFSPFLSGYRTLSKQEGLELSLAMSQYMDIDPGDLALL